MPRGWTMALPRQRGEVECAALTALPAGCNPKADTAPKHRAPANAQEEIFILWVCVWVSIGFEPEKIWHGDASSWCCRRRGSRISTDHRWRAPQVKPAWYKNQKSAKRCSYILHTTYTHEHAVHLVQWQANGETAKRYVQNVQYCKDTRHARRTEWQRSKKKSQKEQTSIATLFIFIYSYIWYKAWVTHAPTFFIPKSVKSNLVFRFVRCRFCRLHKSGKIFPAIMRFSFYVDADMTKCVADTENGTRFSHIQTIQIKEKAPSLNLAQHHNSFHS